MSRRLGRFVYCICGTPVQKHLLIRGVCQTCNDWLANIKKKSEELQNKLAVEIGVEKND